MTTTVRDTPPTLGSDGAESLRWSLHVVHHPVAQFVGHRRVLLPGAALEIARDGIALGPGVLADERLSRHHARIEVDADDQLQVSDLGSRNGTWVNAVSVTRSGLDVGDILRVGSLLLAVEREPAAFRSYARGRCPGLGWAMARVIESASASPVGRVVVLWGEAGVGVELLARDVFDREKHGELLGPLEPAALSRPEFVERLARRDPSAGRLWVWVETFSADPELDLAATRDPLRALGVLVLRVPPLRERVADLMALIDRATEAHHGRPARLHHRLALALLRAPWPGNLAQLDDFVRTHLAPGADGAPLAWSQPLVEALAAHPAIDRMATPTRAGQTGVRCRIARDGRWFETGGVRVAVHPRRALVNLLRALAENHLKEAGAPSATESLVETGWPGEKLVGDSGAGRLYVALSTLRRMGLRDVLERSEMGYRLATGVEVIEP